MSRTRRMAFEDLPQAERTIVRDALRPWSRRLGVLDKETGRFNADLWEGATPEGFINRHDIVRDEIVDLVQQRQTADAVSQLMTRNNHNLEDANQQIYLINRALDRNVNPADINLQKLIMSVPQAEADEHLARAVLELSDWKNVDSLKDTTTRATDITGEYGGYQTLVDAQARTNPQGRLNLSLINELRGDARDMSRDFNQLPDSTLVMDFIRKKRDQSRRGDKGRYESGKEGKLLATTSQFNDNPTQHFINNADVLEKDGIITSNRPTPRRDVHPDHPRLVASSSPYNPELPQGWDLMDLDEARSVLSGMRAGDLRRQDAGYRLFFNPKGRNTSINLGISQEKLKRMQGNLGGLSPVALQALTA